MHPLLKYIFWAICIYIVYCGFLFLMQRKIMFPRGMIPQPASLRKLPGREIMWLENSSGRGESWLLRPVSGSTVRPVPAVIFGHGNGELIDFWPDELKRFTRLGMALLLVEYPGYGRSAGSPSQESITAAFTAAYDMLVARKDVDPDKIILYGRSLGGGAACALAAERPAAAIILASSFTSIKSMAARYLIPGFLVRDPFDNLNVVHQYAGPILIIHGKYDDIIPYRHGKALYKAAKNAKLLTYDCGHNDCPPDPVRFWQDISAFLHESGLKKPL